jgi:hypothetical protein
MSARVCMFCGKPGTDARTIKTWAHVHADCAAKFGTTVWVAK